MMKIGVRLIMMLVLAIGGLLIVGGVGLSAFQAANNAVRTMTDDTIPSIQAMNDIGNAYRDLRSLLLSHILEGDPEAKKGFGKKIADSKDFAKKVIEGYGGIVTDATDKANYERLKAAYTGYIAAFDQVLAKSTEMNSVEAISDLYGKVSPAAQELESTLKKSTEYNTRMQETAGQQVNAVYIRSLTIFAVVIGIVITLLSIFGYMLFRAVKYPLAIMEQTVERIGRDLDFTQRVPIDSRDEVGMTVAAFNRLLDSLQASFREIAHGIGGVSGQANVMANAAQQMSASASAASESAANMASTMEEVTLSISHVVARAQEADTVSRRSGVVAGEGEGVIRGTVDEINAISGTVDEASKQIDVLAQETTTISGVVNVIREVAEQTNLLALNAAIEAARAGEQGRGFAVVADEVRKLAERTSASTQEISKLITTIKTGASGAVTSMKEVVGRVEQGVQKAQRAGDAIGQIRQGAGQVVTMVGDISQAIQEQSTASTHIATQVKRIAQMSEEASGAASHTASAAEVLQSLANQMQGVVARYKL